MLIWTFAVVLFVVMYDKTHPKKKLFADMPYITFLSLGVGSIFMALLLCRYNLFKKPPCNFILLICFTLVWSVFVASFTQDYDPDKVLMCVGLVTAMTIGLSLIGFCLKDEMYWAFGVLATLIFAMIPMVVFVIYIPKLWLTSLLGFLGTISVSVYIIIDTLSILQRLGTDMYVIGALYLYTDIIMLFLYVLALFGAAD